jgi:uncharacterized RDD family membrane protein YckC
MESKRTIAFFIDFFITGMIQAILMMIFIISKSLANELDSSTVLPLAILITFTSMLYMVFRDCLGSKSIGKRIMKLSIISTETNLPAPFAKRLLRNITWLLGPVEIFYYMDSKKRLGDKIAKTNVVA